MRGTSLTVLDCANSRGAQVCTGSAKSSPVLGKIINAIRVAWPRKTAAHVAHLTDMEERTVKFWLAGETRMSVDAVVALLRTEDGFAILEAIMTDSDVKWWVAMHTAHEIRKSRIALKAEEKRHERLRAQLSLLDQ
jgi:hypothetical protein